MDIASLSESELAQIPALRPPPGIVPDFENPSVHGSNARETVITVAFLTALTVLSLILRIYTRVSVLRKTGWDDYMSIGATVGTVAYASLIIYVFEHGFGVHQWNVHLNVLLDNTSHINAIQYIYSPTMLMAKLAICFFFYKIWRTDRKMRWAIIFAAVFNTVFQVTFFFTKIFICPPGSSKFWQCTQKVTVLNMVSASINLGCDVYLLVLPLFGIYMLQMPLKRKWGVSFVFLIGFLTLLSSILGIVYRVRQDRSDDVTWVFAPEIILALFELQATVIAACVMAMPALFSTDNPKSLGYLWKSSRSRLPNSERYGSKSNMSDVVMTVVSSVGASQKSGWERTTASMDHSDTSSTTRAGGEA